MDQFKRRYFHSPYGFLASLASIIAHLSGLPGFIRGRVDMAFRQRLWLAVTSVNDCRYCAWLHSNLALQSGVAAEEVNALSSGGITDSPAEQRPALLYGMHWAEQDGRADPEARARLLEVYGKQTARVIELILSVIRFCNLTASTWDLLLHKISGGRLDVNRPIGRK
jgi:AhpD family alkylhydroperoxidase